MGVTNQMILDLFGQGTRFCDDHGREPARYTCLIDHEGEVPAGVDEDEALLVADPATVARLLDARPNLHAACNARGLDGDARGKLEAAGRALLIDAALTDAQIYRKIGNLFKEVQSWQLKMYRMLAEGCSYSDLLDSSVPVIGCPIILSGTGLEVEGYTTTLPPSNDLAEEAIELGYFDEDAVEYFRDGSMPRLWPKIDGLTLLDDTTSHRGYPLFLYVFHLGGNRHLHCAVHVSNAQPTQGLADKVRLLAEAIELQMHVNPPSQAAFKQGAEALLVQCATGNAAPNRRVREALSKAGVGEDTRYRMHLLDYGYGDGEEALALKMGFDLASRAPSDLVAPVGECVIMLEREPGGAALPTPLEEHRRRHPCSIATSDVLSGVERIQLAYRQAQAARRAASRASDPGGTWQTTFTRSFMAYFLMESRDEQLVEDALEIAVPTRIAAADARNGTGDLELLRCYLACERRANLAAKRLFVHRNTLLYRIRRIEREYSISLDDDATRDRIRAELALMHETGDAPAGDTEGNDG